MINLKQSYLLLFIIAAFSCTQQTPEELLLATKDQINSSRSIIYSSTSYWPDQIGYVDTVDYFLSIVKDASLLTGYSYIYLSEKYDAIYKNNELDVLEHKKQQAFNYSQKYLEHHPSEVTTSRSGSYSPIKLATYDWTYLSDTIINKKRLISYINNDRDTFLSEYNLQVKLDLHLYINPSTKNIDQFERVLYHDGQLSQKIIVTYEDYNYNTLDDLAYSYPEYYATVEWGQARVKILDVGDKAPDFLAISLIGDTVSLADYRGQKLLLDFSTINCGYCKEALYHINQSENFADNITALYINPKDDQSRMTKYMKQVVIPFPIIADREDLGQAYGVNGYPTFFVIDENGIIEQVQEGYTKEFLDQFM